MESREQPENHSHSATFAKVFVALCVLTLASVVIAMVDIFPSRTVQWCSFMGVALVKAALVIAFFMHLRWEKYWKYFLTFPALILGFILAVSLVPDVGNRGASYSRQRTESGPDVTAQQTDSHNRKEH